MRSPLALASLFLVLNPSAARAGDSVCWIENGVLLVPAVVAGVNGVFILDTGAAQSQLDATQASEADVGDAAVNGEVLLAGQAFAKVALQVLALDDRTRAFPTPIAGVLGSDILAGRVIEVRPDPCRVRLSRHGPHTPAEITLPIELRGGVPYVRAGISDGARSAVGAYRIDTGSGRSAALASASPVVLESGRLRALALGGALFEAVPAERRQDASPAAIGEPIWSRFTLRLDYAARVLTLTPAAY